MTNPKKYNGWSLKIDGKTETGELKIAEAFNEHFVNKIDKMKEEIDQSQVRDSLEKLKNKMEGNTYV